MEAVDTAKTISMVLLCVISLILGLVPIWIARKMRWNVGSGQEMSQLAKNVLSSLLCFGAGVLMATALTHILPDVIEGVNGLIESGILNGSLPLGEIFFSAGFFLVYLVEEVVHMIADQHAHNQTDVSIHRSVGVRECSISREGQPVPPCDNGEGDDNDDDECREKTICVSDDCKEEQEFCDSTETSSTSGIPPAVIRSISGDLVKRKESEFSRRISYDDHGHSHHDHHHHHSHAPVGDGDNVLPSVRGLLVIVGLSLHEILEGVAVGLQTTEGDVWNLFAAVASHKFVIAFCVGMEMATNGVRVGLHVFYMITLSVVTSIGIGIGMALIHGDPSDALELTTVVLQGLAGGTLMYVAFFEVLERERSKSSIKLMQWSTLLLGYLAMIGLQALIPEPSGDSNAGNSTTLPFA